MKARVASVELIEKHIEMNPHDTRALCIGANQMSNIGEFDKGERVPIQMSREMNKPLVCANIYDEKTGELVEWTSPYEIVEQAGLRIGIISAITPGTKHIAFEENVAGLEFGEILPADRVARRRVAANRY